MRTPPHSLCSLQKKLLYAASLLALTALTHISEAANFTYTGNTTTTAQWSSGTSWSATPISALDTTLDFSANQTAGITTTSNNDIAGNFTLNRLNITNVATANGTAPVLVISGNTLAFTSNGATAPTLVFGQSNGTATTVRPSVTISNDIILNNSLSISNPNASNQATLSGVISGSGGLNKTSGTGGVNITGTNNSFSGAVVISANGSLTAASIGNTGSNSSLGTNASITLGSTTNSGQLNWTGSNETTDKVFSMGGSTGGATISASTANQTLTISQSLVISGNGTKTLTLGGSGNVAFNGVIPNGTSPNTSVISMTKSGAGTVTLNGTNTYTGGTTISSGTLAFNNDSALGTGAVTLNGTLSALANATLSNNISVATAGTFRVGSGNTFTSSGAISGNGSVSKNSGGTLDFSAATANSFAGGMKIDDGVVVVTALGNSGANSALGTYGTIQLGAGTSAGTIRWEGNSDETTNKVIDFKSTTTSTSGGTITANNTGRTLTFTSNTTATGSGNKTFTLGGSGNINFNGAISNGANATVFLKKSDSGIVTLSGLNTYTGSTTINGGTLTLSANGTMGTGTFSISGGTLDLGGKSVTNTLTTFTSGSLNNGTLTNNGGTYNLGNTTVSANLAGTNGLTTTGNAILSGANTYTGATLVSAGTLLVNASTSASSAVTVNAGATLGGSGTINGAATINGILNPGNSTTLTLGSTLTLGTGSTIALTLGSSSSKISFTSAADNIIGSGNATLSLTQGTGFDYGTTYRIFGNTSTDGFLFASITGYDSAAYTANLADTGSNYDLSFTAVPEPPTYALFVLGLAGLLIHLKRRHSSTQS
ncbi:MAG: PEP-CTERM sorting domain-containing protein [Proteobacteria bacterium]|nr:PEP-CTERM sorting domain-containing protein [Pseudomonadota bacterium]